MMRRMNGVFPPVGTIVGPDWSGMRLTADTIDERGVTLRPTTNQDLAALGERNEIHSVTEFKLLRVSGLTV